MEDTARRAIEARDGCLHCGDAGEGGGPGYDKGEPGFGLMVFMRGRKRSKHRVRVRVMKITNCLKVGPRSPRRENV